MSGPEDLHTFSDLLINLEIENLHTTLNIEIATTLFISAKSQRHRNGCLKSNIYYV